MHIKRDFELSFNLEEYIDMQEGQSTAFLSRPSIAERIDSVLAEIHDLVDPVACYDSFPIAEYLHERLRLENGVRIGGGPVVEVVHGAEELLVAVCTVGPAIEERLKAYRTEGERFKMMVLDDLGSWAVGQVREQVYEFFQQEAEARGWRVSTFLSPGESEWSVADQPAIFELLDTAQIGVALNESCVMSPLKSLSLIAGTGRNEMGAEGLTNCDFCTIRERCRYRLSRLEEQA